MSAIVVSKTINRNLTIPATRLASFPPHQGNREAADGRTLQTTSDSSSETSWGIKRPVDPVQAKELN